MKQLIPFIKKEFYHIFRDRETLIIIFVMPIILVILFGYAIRSEVKESRVAILDKSKDELSIDLVNNFLATDYFVFDTYLNSDVEIAPAFQKGDISLVMVIPENFSRDFYNNKLAEVQIITDASNLNTSTVLKSYAQAIVENFRADKLNLDSHAMPFGYSTMMVYNPVMKDVYMFVPGVLTLILMTISALMTAISLTREKELGTLNVLTVSPLRTVNIIIGKIIPYLVLSVLNTIMILGLSVYLFDIPINGSLWTLAIACTTFLVAAFSIGIFISSISNTQQVAIFISIIALFLPTMLLSGFIYPIENMPVLLQILCNIFPAKWFIEALKAVMMKGSSLVAIWPQLAVLTLTTIIMLRLSIVRYSKRK